MRLSLGPVTKAAEEKFWLEVAIYATIPTGETIQTVNLQAQKRGVTPVEYSTDILFGVTPEIEIDNDMPMVRARMIAGAPATVTGEHLVEFEIITNVGTKFEAEVFLNVLDRLENILHVDKKEQEQFPIGIDFSDALATGETISSGVIAAVEKFQETDTTLILFFSATAQITDGLVTGEMKPLSDGSQIDMHEVKFLATTSDGNLFTEWVSVAVEASQSTEP
jgi:hypothetical protein